MAENWQAYVPYDTDLILRGIADIREKIGISFNIAIWIFLIVTAVLTVISIVRKFGG